MKEQIQAFFTTRKLPQAITNWVSRSSAVKAARLFWESDLNVSNLYQLVNKLSTQHVTAAKELYQDYNAFISQPAVTKRDIKLKKKEKLAYELSKRTKELSAREQQQLATLLVELETEENIRRATTLATAQLLVDDIIVKHGKIVIEETMIQELKRSFQSKWEADGLDSDEIIFLVRSKLHILAADQKMQAPQTVKYVVPVYKEFNRLKKKSELFTGEDLLQVKCDQLSFLYSGCTNLNWEMYFVDDEPPTAPRRSIDVIKDAMQNDSNLVKYQEHVKYIGYEDLTNQIACYSDKSLSQLSPEEFAKKSIKGGAVQCALMYLAGIGESSKQEKVSDNDLILMTDADLSTNLGITGYAVSEMLTHTDVAMTIGSRRLPGSVVVGKSDERHLLSFGFNFLAHALLNVQVSDTQVGCKIIRASAIDSIYEQFNDLTMSFDVEMIRALQANGLSIKSIPTYWQDSPFESKSADQGQNMFAGLISIFRRIYSLEATNPSTSIVDADSNTVETLANKLAAEPEFADLMKLATDPKFHLLVAFSSEIYGTLTPKTWRNFVNHLSLFLCELAENKISQETMNLLFEDISRLATEVRETPAVEFLMHEFPQLFSIAALLYKNRDYAQIIAPMLFGDRIAGRIFSKGHYRDLATFCREEKIDNTNLNAHQLLNQWVIDSVRKTPAPATDKESAVVNSERQKGGLDRLQALSEQLTQPIFVSIVMQYDMDKTNPAYANAVIKEKMALIAKALKDNNIKNVEIELVIVDARSERTSGIEKHIDEILKTMTVEGVVTGRQIAMPTEIHGTGKANAVRFGMNDAKQNGSDIVGYIDFSNKIPVLDITHLLADVIEEKIKGNPSAAIGSRRQTASEVVNKPLTFLLRSTGLNLAVKSLFPELFNITDSQTGFKLFSSDAWDKIARHLQCESLAFDVEILILLAKLGITIKEEPVTFNDNNLDNTELAGPANQMFPDLLRIRAHSQKFGKIQASIEAPRRIAAGAEHTVYDLGDDSLLKIPTQFADPDFMILLRNLVFSKEQGLAHTDRETGLFISQFNHLLTSKYLTTFVPLLRDISDVNVFVMRMISTLESKTKSFDLSKVLKYGKDIVGPFEFCDSFSITLNNKVRTFDSRHQVKRAVKAKKIFKDEFYSVLQSHYKENMTETEKQNCYQSIYQKLDEAIDLFLRMWKRGLFDLDTNILSDIGYFQTETGLILMSLDPGEITDDLSIINVDTAIALLSKRSDILLMKTQLSAFPGLDPDKIINYYIANMTDFLEMVRNDITTDPEIRQFGSEVRENPSADFTIKCQFADSLPEAKAQPALLTEEETSNLIAAGYQLPFTSQPLDTLPSIVPAANIHLLVNKVDQYTPEPGVEINEIERGSILPLCQFVKQRELLNHPENLGIVLDAGSGTRSSLLGIQAGSKGKINIADHSLLTYATSTVQDISTTLAENGLTDYVIISSCDDLFANDKRYINNLIKYFALTDSPGLYWTELPESGKKHMPLTLEDTIAFMNSHFVRDKVNELFTGIPFTEGYVKEDVVNKALDSIQILYDQFQAWQNSHPEESKSGQTANVTLPGVNEAATRYMKLLQWYGMTNTQSAGIKRPFLMVMKKEFLQDFMDTVAAIIPEYTKTYITWENILLRGLKADRTVWNMFGKPPHVSKEKWNKIYDAIQALKIRHHIDTDSNQQNQLRADAPTWQSLDDPYAVMTTVERIYQTKPKHVQQAGECKLVSDRVLNPNQVQLSAEKAVNIVAIGCNLNGLIAPRHPAGEVATYKVIENILISGVTLEAGEKLEPIPGHVVVEIDGDIYSTSLIPNTKDNLKSQPVYHYDRQTGKPDENPVSNKLSDFAAILAKIQAAVKTSARFAY